MSSGSTSTDAAMVAAAAAAGTARAPVVMDVTLAPLYPVVHRSAEALGWQLLVRSAAGAPSSTDSGVGEGGGEGEGGGSGGGRSDWNVAWHDQSISSNTLCALQPHQHINHFPGIIELNRKVRMARRLGQMKARFPEAYGFVPDSWCLPMEETAVREAIRLEQAEGHREPNRSGGSGGSGVGDGGDGDEGTSAAASPPETVFIIKPDKGSQGKGIYLYSTSQPVPDAFAPPNEEVGMVVG
jgi:hypothetical protein